MEAAEKLVKLLHVMAICVLFVGLFIVLTEHQYTSVAEDKPTAIECGSCGAHVYEYWYWENINDGTPVKICRYCYENCIENTDTEN